MARPRIPTTAYIYGCLVSASIVLLGVSLGTPHWVDWDRGTEGLFQQCYHGNGSTVCYDVFEDFYDMEASGTMTTTINLVLFGMVFYLLTLVSMVHLTLTDKRPLDTKALGYFWLLVSIIGAILTSAGSAKYVAWIRSSEHVMGGSGWTFGYSVYLAIASSMLVAGGAFIGLRAVRQMIVLRQLSGLLTQQQGQGHQPTVPMGIEPRSMKGYDNYPCHADSQSPPTSIPSTL